MKTRFYTIFTRDDFSVVAFVENRPCPDAAAVEAYYYSLGQHLFLLHVLGASDIIGDNIICDAGAPGFIDLELLFSKPLKPTTFQTYFSEVDRLFFDSVIRTGMLPRWTVGDASDEKDALIGATTAVNAQLIKRVVREEITATAVEQVVDYARFSDSPDQHLPWYKEQYVPIDAYLDVFVNGFSDAYSFFAAEKATLLAAVTALLEESLTLRVIMRDTSVYTTLLRESSKPQVLQSGNHLQDFIFEHLWAASDDVFFSDALIYSEINQIRQGDIPMFFTRSDENAVTDCKGTRVLSSVFQSDAREFVASNIEKLGSKDLEFQVKVIRGLHAIYFEKQKLEHEIRASR